MLWYVVCSEILFCICHCLSISSKMKRLLLASSLTQGATTTSLVVSSLIWFYTGCLSWHNLKQHLSSNQTSIFFSTQANVTTATKASLASLLWPLTSKVYFYPKNRLEDILYYLDCDESMWTLDMAVWRSSQPIWHQQPKFKATLIHLLLSFRRPV